MPDSLTRIFARTNVYTWHVPCCDIYNGWNAEVYTHIVAVSVWDIDSTLEIPIKIKFWYMRGWEKWVHGEEWLIQQIKKFVAAGGRIIVSSSWLIDQLKEKAGVDSVLCWAGLDLDFWKDDFQFWEVRLSGDSIGSLGSSKHKTKHFDIIQKLRECFPKKTFLCTDGTFDKYRMYLLYNACDIWLAPTELEGFHQCPAEANLCGRLVVCNRMPSNGMGDYANDDTAMRYDTWEELIECIENPDFSKVPKMQRVLREKIGNREGNMRKFVEILES
jgi:hypothetical protein